MAIKILDHCPSCGVCTKGVCPTDAIKVENGKTFIAEGCIDCGLCIPVCPIGIIVESQEAPQDATPVVQQSKSTRTARRQEQGKQLAAPLNDSAGGEEADHEETSTGA